MADGKLGQVVSQLRRLLSRPPLQGDGELLERFAQNRDEAAFEELVQRHGPVVRAACRRVLRDADDADDAFQAAFLVLAKKAGRIRRPERLSSWLYGVAVRIALNHRKARIRRIARETQAMTPISRSDDSSWRDLRTTLDVELARLPERYRLPLVLCYLEGKSHDESARQLGWSRGTMSGRLARAKQLLRDRLGRRGVALSLASLGEILREAAAPCEVSAAVARATAEAAVRFANDAALATTPAALARALLHGPFWSDARFASIFALIAACCGVTITALSWTDRPTSPDSTEAPRVELGDNSLPVGARLRLGDPRFRHDRVVVQSVACSADGNLLASADGTWAYLWSADGRELHRFGGMEFPILSMALSPDGRHLASATAERGVRVWRVADQAEILRLADTANRPSCLAISPDGRVLATSGPRNSTGHDDDVLLFDLQTSQLVGRLGCGALRLGRASALAFSPDGKTLASGHVNRVVVWETATGACRSLLGSTDRNIWSIEHLTFSPDNALLAGATSHRKGPNVHVWRIQDGHELILDDQARCLVFANPSTLVVGGDGMRSWNPLTRKRIAGPAESWLPVGALAPSSEGDSFLVGCFNFLVRWHVGEGQRGDALRDPYGSILDLAVASDGRSLAASSDDGSIHVWNMDDGVVQRRFRLSKMFQPRSVAFSPDGRLLAAGFRDARSLVVWDLVDGRTLLRAEPPDVTPFGVLGVGFSPCGKFAFAQNHEEATLYDLATGKQHLHVPAIRLDFAPSGDRLAVLTDRVFRRSRGLCIELRSFPDFDLLAELRDDEGFWTTAFSPDGKTLAAVGGDRRQHIRLWNAQDGTQPRDLDDGAHDNQFTSLAFSSDSKTLHTATNDGKYIVQWDVATGKIRHESAGPGGFVWTLQPFRRDKLLVQTGGDPVLSGRRVVHVIAPRDGKIASPFDSPLDGYVVRAVLAKDEKTLVTAHTRSTIVVWNLE